MKSVLPTIALVLLALFLWKGQPILLYGAVLCLSIHIFLPALDQQISRGWRKLGEVLAIIPNAIVLGLVWWLVVTPLGWISRRGKNPLWIRKPNLPSFWKTNTRNYSPRDLEKPW